MRRFITLSIATALVTAFALAFVLMNYWEGSARQVTDFLSLIVFALCITTLSINLSKLIIAMKYDRWAKNDKEHELPRYIRDSPDFGEKEGFTLATSFVVFVPTLPWVWYSLQNILHL